MDGTRCSDKDMLEALSQLNTELALQSPLFGCLVSLMILLFVLIVLLIIERSTLASKMRMRAKSRHIPRP